MYITLCRLIAALSIGKKMARRKIFTKEEEKNVIRLNPECINGPILVLKKDDRFYWGIEDYWYGCTLHEISEKLYNAIVEFKKERENAKMSRRNQENKSGINA